MRYRSPGALANVRSVRERLRNPLSIISGVLLLAVTGLQTTQAQKKGPTEQPAITISNTDIQSLDRKLTQFKGQLAPSELGAMNRLLFRAAAQPSGDPGGTLVKASFFDVRGPGVAADENGDRGGGRPPGQGRVTNPGLGAVQAQDREPNRPPPPPPDPISLLKAGVGVDSSPASVATTNALGSKLQTFGGTLSRSEKGIMDWLMDRAGQNQSGPRTGTPGGPPPTLTQALGIAAFGSRSAAAGGNTWVLRFAPQ